MTAGLALLQVEFNRIAPLLAAPKVDSIATGIPQQISTKPEPKAAPPEAGGGYGREVVPERVADIRRVWIHAADVILRHLDVVRVELHCDAVCCHTVELA